jgi:hypothetical protein
MEADNMKENDFLDKAIEELKKAGSDTTASQQVVDKTLDRLAGLENEQKKMPVRAGWAGFLKIAVAAVIFLSVGLYAGRLTKPAKIDTEQLASLETTLKTSIEMQLNKNLQEKIEQNFTDFVNMNSEQLSELASTIDDTQQWQRLVIAAVLEQMELNRQNENEELRNALVNFASQTEDKITQTEAILVKLIEKNNTQKSPENQKDNLQ